MIVGIGSVGVMQLAATCTMQNRAAADLTVAAMLAQHVQEMVADLPISDPSSGTMNFGPEVGETIATYDDVDDFDGTTLSPPLDSTRTPLAGMSAYSQKISVYPVSAKQLNGNLTGGSILKSTYTGAVRVRVQILRLNAATNTSPSIYSMEWIRVEN